MISRTLLETRSESIDLCTYRESVLTVSACRFTVRDFKYDPNRSAKNDKKKLVAEQDRLKVCSSVLSIDCWLNSMCRKHCFDGAKRTSQKDSWRGYIWKLFECLWSQCCAMDCPVTSKPCSSWLPATLLFHTHVLHFSPRRTRPINWGSCWASCMDISVLRTSLVVLETMTMMQIVTILMYF